MSYSDYAPTSLEFARYLWADITDLIDARDPQAEELLRKFAEHDGWRHFNFADGTMFASLEQFREAPRPWGLGVNRGESLSDAANRHQRERDIPQQRQLTGRASEAEEVETPVSNQDALNALAFARQILATLAETRRPDINDAGREIARESLQTKLAYFDQHRGWELVRDEDGSEYTSLADFIHRGLGVA